MATKICVSNYVNDIYQVQNFIQIGSGASVLRMRDFAPLGTKWLSYFFGPWERLQLRRALRFWRKIRQTTRIRARKCLLEVAKQPKCKVSTPFSPKTVPLAKDPESFSVSNRFGTSRCYCRLLTMTTDECYRKLTATYSYGEMLTLALRIRRLTTDEMPTIGPLL